MGDFIEKTLPKILEGGPDSLVALLLIVIAALGWFAVYNIKLGSKKDERFAALASSYADSVVHIQSKYEQHLKDSTDSMNRVNGSISEFGGLLKGLMAGNHTTYIESPSPSRKRSSKKGDN